MEDILASIKRIIAEDGETPPPAARLRRGPVAVPDPEPEAPETDERPAGDDTADEAADAAVAEEGERAAPDPAGDPADILELTSPIVEPAGWRPAAMLSASAEQVSRHAFASLAQARPEEPARGTPIEAFLTDMLRPMLSDWLDRELPAIVERIVTTEVRRISGRG